MLEFDPPHRFSFTWGGEELHLGVEPRRDGCVRQPIWDAHVGAGVPHDAAIPGPDLRCRAPVRA